MAGPAGDVAADSPISVLKDEGYYIRRSQLHLSFVEDSYFEGGKKSNLGPLPLRGGDKG